MSAHSHASTGEKGYEADIASSEMTTVGLYGFVLAVVFFSTLGGLYMYFRHASAAAVDARIGVVENQDLKAKRAADQKALGGIDAAMKSVAGEYTVPAPVAAPAPAAVPAAEAPVTAPAAAPAPAPAH
jgi:hypothetical protein